MHGQLSCSRLIDVLSCPWSSPSFNSEGMPMNNINLFEAKMITSAKIEDQDEMRRMPHLIRICDLLRLTLLAPSQDLFSAALICKQY